MKTIINEYEIAQRILKKINFGILEVKNDVIIFNNNVELKKFDDGTWGAYHHANSKTKYYPDFIQALESAIINEFMKKLSIALYDEEYYNEGSINLNE